MALPQWAERQACRSLAQFYELEYGRRAFETCLTAINGANVLRLVGLANSSNSIYMYSSPSNEHKHRSGKKAPGSGKTLQCTAPAGVCWAVAVNWNLSLPLPHPVRTPALKKVGAKHRMHPKAEGVGHRAAVAVEDGL